MNPVRKLNLESLEDRICLAGNVIATVEQIVGYEGLTAVFQGDQFANSVQIIQIDQHDYTALGVGFGEFDTTINGFDQLQLNNIQNFLFDMGGGDDLLFINGDTAHQAPGQVTIDGQVKIFGRGGADNVLIEDSKIRDNLYANLGAGNNFFQLIDSRVNGETRLESFSGNDFFGTFRSTLAGPVSASMGQGKDAFWSGSDADQLMGSRFLGPLSVRTGSGADQVRLDQSVMKDEVSILTGNGRDEVSAHQSRFRSDAELKIWTGKHQDRLELVNSTIRNVWTSVRLGDGPDTFEAHGIRDSGSESGARFQIGAGKHRDRIMIADSTLGREVQIDGHHGNDEIRVEDSRLGRKTKDDGPGVEGGQGRLLVNGGIGSDFTELIDLIANIPVNSSPVEALPKISAERISVQNIRVEPVDVHQQIQGLLAQLRRLQGLQVTVEVRFVTVDDSFFERIGVDFDFDVEEQTGGLSMKKLPGQPGTFDASFELEFEQGGSYRIKQFETEPGMFGGFDPAAGLGLGFAILSDLETFLFIQAAREDQKQQDRNLTLKVAPVLDLANQTVQLNVEPQAYFTSTTFGFVQDH